ncbi:L-type lectin-domain containing receptor kinase IX.1 isoform X2 [Ziziphus jujuba]|uniref:non-specific serine/threonine protein kinase n=1 Tax=Ziziphus jujuba TaxID=326968 RepID=A0ABM3IVX4_ZIZJJ|nr:L-type lectin-domain containing receptor kinase IX.1 isoform X2 [Ziziphus jujuba]
MALWYPGQHISASLITTFLLLNYIPYSSFSLEFDYPVLDQHNRTLITQGNTTYLGSEIQLTKLNKTDQIGHVKYFEDFQLWDKATGRVWDFTTSFSFIIYSPFDPRGDGLAFFLAQPPFGIPSTTDASGMGLTEAGGSTSSSHPFVAVEFDTLRNYFDPIDVGEHVGVNVKDMISKRVTFGFSAANGLFTSRHILRSWSFHSGDFTTSTTSDSPKKTSTNSKTRLVIGISVGVCVFVGALAFISFGIWKWKKSTEEEGEDDDELSIDPLMDNDFERSSGAKRFSYDELVAATANFSEEEKLGQGGFGCVYRGFLKNMSSYVAIKKISTKSQQGIKEYASEVKIITQLRHRNLVQLIGWCHRKKDLLLIYEFMSNGSLDVHLFRGKSLLTWAARYNIARGLASALLYLHEEWEQCVLHRDIKSSNVMLDSNFNAKLGDFGLARLVDHEKGSQTTMVAGTLGYLAPECFATNRARRESDVYSFGVVILEIACGRKPFEPEVGESDHEGGLVEWVWKLYGMEKVLEAADPRLCREFDEQQMERLMIVGLWSAHPDYNMRPSIKQATHVLEFEAPLPALPLEMPLPTYLSPSFPQFLYGSTSASEDTKTESSTTISHYTSS